MKSKKLIVPPRNFFHGGHYIISFFFIGWFCTYIKNTIKISIILGFFFLNFWGPWDPAPASSTPGPTDVMLLFIHVPFFFYLYVVLTMASHGHQWSLYTNNNNNNKKSFGRFLLVLFATLETERTPWPNQLSAFVIDSARFATYFSVGSTQLQSRNLSH